MILAKNIKFNREQQIELVKAIRNNLGYRNNDGKEITLTHVLRAIQGNKVMLFDDRNDVIEMLSAIVKESKSFQDTPVHGKIVKIGNDTQSDYENELNQFALMKKPNKETTNTTNNSQKASTLTVHSKKLLRDFKTKNNSLTTEMKNLLLSIALTGVTISLQHKTLERLIKNFDNCMKKLMSEKLNSFSINFIFDLFKEALKKSQNHTLDIKTEAKANKLRESLLKNPDHEKQFKQLRAYFKNHSTSKFSVFFKQFFGNPKELVNLKTTNDKQSEKSKTISP